MCGAPPSPMSPHEATTRGGEPAGVASWSCSYLSCCLRASYGCRRGPPYCGSVVFGEAGAFRVAKALFVSLNVAYERPLHTNLLSVLC